MPLKKNPLKLNKLQLRTLTLAQLLAQDPSLARRDEATGVVTLLQIPHAHGDHLHIGRFTVSTREASVLRNPACLTADRVRATGPATAGVREPFTKAEVQRGPRNVRSWG